MYLIKYLPGTTPKNWYSPFSSVYVSAFTSVPFNFPSSRDSWYRFTTSVPVSFNNSTFALYTPFSESSFCPFPNLSSPGWVLLSLCNESLSSNTVPDKPLVGFSASIPNINDGAISVSSSYVVVSNVLFSISYVCPCNFAGVVPGSCFNFISALPGLESTSIAAYGCPSSTVTVENALISDTLFNVVCFFIKSLTAVSFNLNLIYISIYPPAEIFVLAIEFVYTAVYPSPIFLFPVQFTLVPFSSQESDISYLES